MDTSSEIAGDEDTAALRRLLRERGLRVTGPRLAVLQALAGATGHRSVDEIAASVEARYPAVDRVSLYRTLETFEDAGLVFRVVLGDKVLRWERATRAHHHVLCRHCRAVVEVGTAPFERLAADLLRAYGVRVDLRHLALQGLCARCVASTDALTPRPPLPDAGEGEVSFPVAGEGETA